MGVSYKDGVSTGSEYAIKIFNPTLNLINLNPTRGVVTPTQRPYQGGAVAP